MCVEPRKRNRKAKSTDAFPNLALLNRLLDLLDFDLAEALDLQEGFTRRGMDGLDGVGKMVSRPYSVSDSTTDKEVGG